MRTRVGLGFSPSWKGSIEGWARKFVYANQWRCDPTLEPADLMQDAYLTYVKVVEYYPTVRTPQHFMSLFQRALENDFHNHARQKRLRHQTILDVEADLPDHANWGYVAAALAEAPEELKLALAIFADRDKCAELAREQPRSRFSRKTLRIRENLNAKLTRLAGLDRDVDVVTALREMFT